MPNVFYNVMADELDFRGEFRLLSDSNTQLLQLGISQKNLLIGFAVLFILLFVCLIVVTVLVLVELIQVVETAKLGSVFGKSFILLSVGNRACNISILDNT